MRDVIERVLHFQCANAYTLPLNVEALCRTLGVTLRPLSEIVRDSGLRAEEVCACWGNEDGALQRMNGRFVIAFNDARPPRRRRFTLCEEAAHCLLGHLDLPGFAAERQDYDEAVYQLCEREARFAAGLLLCPPRWFFAQETPTAALLMRRCGVSAACARHILADYAQYGEAIRACPTYGFTRI